ncbi:MAG: FecR domain-containing protein [Alphaproteobacteria bacterium]|nr:FecR domain-containing protein [Alphaproteobacteria bacterium]
MQTRRQILFAVGAAGLSSLSPVALADTAAGSVVGLRGACLVQRQGRSTPLKMGDAIAATDTVTVPADGKLKLRMADGSVIALASGTTLTVATYQTDAGGQRQNAQLTLGDGLLRAVVAPVGHAASFEVSTAVGTAAVRSTDWFIEAKPGSAQVGVLTGTVSLTSRTTGRAVTIPSRWGARLEAGRDPVPARVWAPEEFQAVITRTDVP